MSAHKGRLAVVERQADPARAELSSAINQAARARETLSKCDASIARGRELVSTTENLVESAAAGVEDARHQHAGALSDAIGDNAPLPASSAVEAALRREADAKLALEQAAAGLGRLKQDRHDHELAITLADLAVIAEINKLLAPTIERIVIDAEAAAATLPRALSVLGYLGKLNLVGAGSNIDDREVDDALLAGLSRSEREVGQRAKKVIPAPLEARVRSLSHFGHFAQFNQPPDVQLVARWREACARLRADASAVLPDT